MSKELLKRAGQKTSGGYLKYSVSADISKEKFDGCVSVIDMGQQVKVIATKSFKNSDCGFKEFDKWHGLKCKEAVPVVFIMEATGVYYEKLAWYLHRQGYHVSVVLPNKSKKYMQSLGLKSKNDKIDSIGLARMGAEQCLAKWNAPREIIVELRDITRHRESLQESKTRFNNQLSSYLCGEFVNGEIVEGLESIVAMLDRQIGGTEKLIKEKVASDGELQNGAEKLVAIKGLGIISVATILAETNCFEMFSNHRQLVSFTGYDVVQNQSGRHVGKTKISKKGNAHIRRILHMPALNVVRFGVPEFVEQYQRIFERTKIKMKGYVAVQRKLLCLIYTLWKNKEDYDQNRYKNNKHPEMQSRSSSFRMAS